MIVVKLCELPEHALLSMYRDGESYADCYVVEVPGSVPQSAFVEAFYTTALFKVERALLTWFAKRPSTDQGARQLAQGVSNSFAAWRVEGRDDDQLLVKAGRTRSWFMASTTGQGTAIGTRTRLYFGSAVVPMVSAGGGRKFGFAFQALLGFHKLYSRALLRAATSRLESQLSSVRHESHNDA